MNKYEELAKKYDGVKTKQLPNGIQFKKNKTSVTIYPSTGTIVSDVHGKINVLKKAGTGKLEYELNKNFSVVEPKQKEYLVKTNTGYTLQVLSNLVDGHDGIIEVPEGADTLAGDDNCNYFWKHSDSGKNEIIGCGESLSRYPTWDSCKDSAKEWLSYFKDQHDMRILWKRNESINDQVASAEQARQEQKQCRCSIVEIQESDLIFGVQGITAESIQVGMMHHGFTQPEELPFIGGEHKDNINSPSHYTKGKIECIDAIESATMDKNGIEAVCVANIIKYLWRYEDKGGLESIHKAKWYIEKLIEIKNGKGR